MTPRLIDTDQRHPELAYERAQAREQRREDEAIARERFDPPPAGFDSLCCDVAAAPCFDPREQTIVVENVSAAAAAHSLMDELEARIDAMRPKCKRCGKEPARVLGYCDPCAEEMSR